MLTRLAITFLVIVAAIYAVPVKAAATDETVQTAWRLLDYVAVDYGGAVKNGRIISQTEFAEMREFTATVQKKLAELPAGPERTILLSRAATLQRSVKAKSPAAIVSKEARELGAKLLQDYPVPLAPAATPDLNKGGELFATNCSSCHGVSGWGDGAAAASLKPRPVNFHDRDRAKERSVFALEQVIAQGLSGTAMPSFAQLPAEDRWALAFKISGFAFSPQEVAKGENIWKADAKLRARVPSLAALASLTPSGLAELVGAERAWPVMAYLRSHPEAVTQPVDGSGSLKLTREKLAASVAAFEHGDKREAGRLALASYLDGFEPVEPMLAARDAGLMSQIEGAMGEFRARLANGSSIQQVKEQAILLDGLFARAETALAPRDSSSVSTFVSALTILLREGVEALLIVIAMIAFLRKAGRSEALPLVHAGWIAALGAGVLTWFVATTLITVSGASRELTEGFGGVFAAFVLVFVGIWMHGKAQADAWQRYVREKVDGALSRGSGWFLFGLAFIIVYREVFETILFFAAMWEESPGALLSGVVAGSFVLAAIAWAMLRYSQRLPIAQFFRYSSVLMAILAVILAGKGVAALQEAGLLNVTPWDSLPRLEAFGLYPSAQVVLAQMAALCALLIGFRLHRAPRSDDGASERQLSGSV